MWNADRIHETVEKQRAFFRSGKTLPPEFRIRQLRRLKQKVTEYSGRLTAALQADLGRSAAEAYLEHACQSVLSKDPDLDGASQLAEKAYKTDPAYIKNAYLADSGQEKTGPADAESVKRLLVRKVANHQ